MAVIIRNPRLTVEEFIGDPEIGYIGHVGDPQGPVPTLAFTVTYEAIIGGAPRAILEFISFVEHISIEGVYSRFSEALPVEPGRGDEDQHIPREHTFLVEKKMIVNELGPLGAIPVRCLIEIRTAFPIEREEFTNTVTVAGEKSRFTVAAGLVKRAFAWSRDQIVERWSSGVRSRDER